MRGIGVECARIALSGRKQTLLRRQPRRAAPLRARRVGGPHLSRSALQEQPGLQCPLRRERRHTLFLADHSVRGHMGVEPRRRARLPGSCRAGGMGVERDAGVSQVPRQQRHDGVSRHDGSAPSGVEACAQGDRLDLSALRPDCQPLSEDADGFGVRAGELSE